MTKHRASKGPNRIHQGEVLSDAEYIESAYEISDNIVISKIVFPLIYVLTQDCDLEQERKSEIKGSLTNDKSLLSILVAPIYNFDQFVTGDHLSELGYKMQAISAKEEKSDNKNIRTNQNPRYHFLKFDIALGIPPSVIDFKHYFTINSSQLRRHRKSNFVCRIQPLYREQISQRFSAYLSRIGLPDGV